MSICSKHTKPILFLWGFNDEGNPYMDARIEAIDANIKNLLPLSLRTRFHPNLKWALLHVSLDTSIEEIEAYIDSGKHPDLRETVIKKLNDAFIKDPRHFVRLKHESPAVEFIIQGNKPKCSCEEDEEE